MRYKVKPLIIALFLLTGNNCMAQELFPTEDEEADTLREVVVRPDSLLPIDRVLQETLKKNRQPSIPTISDLLEKIKPGLNDIIMHPTAIKQRKKERRMKRLMKTLNNYDKVRTFDELLHDAYEQQMLEDSLARMKTGK